ncbi:MAG: hypothetical protein ACI83W_000733 [Marinoscillum sp.]|jgi:hypothetical protein
MKVKVSYQTLQLPPPHSFAYTLEMNFHADHIDIVYDLEFLNRDEVTDEELEEEGYTKDDNFQWKGSLGQVWVNDLKDDILDVELEEESEDFNTYLHFEIETGEETMDGLAVLAEDWDYRLQEVIQAIYEKAGIESKLMVKFINKDGAASEYFELTASFEHQTTEVNKKSITWEQLHELMSDMYVINFEEEPQDNPDKNGLWIDPDGQSGYQLFDAQAGPKANKIKSRILSLLSV